VTETRCINSDLLIIGGGSAGCMAAIRALEVNPRLKVVVFEKADIKYSGSIARGMDALNVVAIPGLTSPELYVEAVKSSCQGIVDAAPSYEMARRSFGTLKKLEGWGVRFPKDKNGQYRTLKYHVKGRFQTAMEEPDLKVMISRMAQEKGALAINRVMGLRLLENNGRVAGAIGLHVRTGELIACRAGAVILTAGGQARFSLPNSGHLYGTFDYPGNSGDGYAMAFRAGASVTGMEYTDRSILIKDANMPLLAITVTRGGRVMDIYDTIIMENECHSLGRMDEAVNEGRGPLRIKLSHLRPEIIEEIESILFSTERPVQERFFKGRGIDFRKRDIELWPTECQLCGGHGMSGVYVNEKAQSDVPGLFVAGDVASVPKQHLTGAFVFGEVAAEQAVEFLSRESETRFNDGQIRAIEEERTVRFSSAGKDIDVRELEYKVRRLIGDYVTSPKNEYKLRQWMEWAERFRYEIKTQISIRNAHELSKLYEVENILECACFSAMASMERKESRWGDAHRRTDFPDRDDRNFLCHIVLKQGSDPTEINVIHKPVIKLDNKEVGG
jgi:succinate dehydrogenase/fumarate reductase flavoprotein subunit